MSEIKKMLREFGLLTKLYIILSLVVIFSGSNYISNYCMQILSIMVVISIFTTKIKDVKRSSFFIKKDKFIFILMVLINLFLVWQLQNSFSKNTSLVFIMRFIVYALLIAIIYKMEVFYTIIKLSKIYSIVVAFSILIETVITGEKSGGLIGDYQYVGIIMCIMSGIFIASIYCEKNKLDVIELIVIVTTLLTSGKRSLTIIVVIGYLAIFLISSRKDKIIRFLKINSILALSISLAYLFIPQVRLVFERFMYYSGDKTLNGRMFYWSSAIEIWQNNTFTGIGMGSFSKYFDIYYHRLGNLEAYDAHNIYIQMLAEIGTIGFLLFCSLFIIAFIKTFIMARDKYVRQNSRYQLIIYFSFYIQVWFIIYGFSGNALYGPSQLYIYILSIAMMISVKTRIYFNECFKTTI